MKRRSRLLPYPLLSVGIALLWLVIAGSYTPNSLLLGLAIGLALPAFILPFLPDLPRVHRPARAIALFLRVCGDIILANWEVARLVLGPASRLAPRFFIVPLSTDDPFVATLLGSIVSLTPGTVTIDIDMQAGTLLIHGLRITDEAATITTIKQRYEAPLMELFQQ